MSAAMATQRVFESLRLARVSNRLDVASALVEATPGEASFVHGTEPSGEVWDYFLVPMLNRNGDATALVMLSAQDGGFLGISLPDRPMPHRPLNENHARQRAQALLGSGERLSAGSLSWQPAHSGAQADSPLFPYFEFVVKDSHETSVAYIRIGHTSSHPLALRIEPDRAAKP